ncbi:hypothetical protein M440DRAFT_1059913 [Trichoderma longibrachiatum ATCC 18648]|uniref:Uncharacterized protein n=1 Tax=Trichoderma longibrachiatum ATCC 18648 TaxID=983965 RepID=A0A2T4BVH9_TRILO|nr:hypothetical protein M440DRAFT_1059913 [Trichoderma longibrachiatum ATCC 18648]
MGDHTLGHRGCKFGRFVANQAALKKCDRMKASWRLCRMNGSYEAKDSKAESLRPLSKTPDKAAPHVTPSLSTKLCDWPTPPALSISSATAVPPNATPVVFLRLVPIEGTLKYR